MTFDSLILISVKVLGGLSLVLFLFILVSWLAWYLYRQVVAWDKLVKAMKHFKESFPAQGGD